MNDSHNSCVSSVASITNELGFASIVELTTDDESSIRPDITTYFASCTVQSDLTLRWPCALTHVRNPLLLEHAEKAKHRKYDAHVTGMAAWAKNFSSSSSSLLKKLLSLEATFY